jgi:hypothetical protein
VRRWQARIATAFGWARASWGNAEDEVLRDAQAGRRNGDERGFVAEQVGVTQGGHEKEATVTRPAP